MKTKLKDVLLNNYRDDMVLYIKNHPSEFDKLIDMAVYNDDILSWRAAWLLNNSMENNDKRLKKHIDFILSVIKEKSEGHQRELLRALTKMELNESQEVFLYDNCIEIWKEIHKKPGVRYVAFRIIIKIAYKYPDLFEEIFIFTQPHYLESLSKGAKHSINKILMKINK